MTDIVIVKMAYSKTMSTRIIMNLFNIASVALVFCGLVLTLNLKAKIEKSRVRIKVKSKYNQK